MPSANDQLAALQRIAVFSARLRGHELGKWRGGEGSATARCVRCGRQLQVHFSLIQPGMDGPALTNECDRAVAARATADKAA